MAHSRRRFLRVIGGGFVVAATGSGLAGCSTGMPVAAIEGWSGPPATEQDPRRWALAHALLAPNPHNIQPWIVDLHTPGRIVLYYDRARALPETDPFYRQLVIGCGAFLELLQQALRARGYAAVPAYFPDGEFEAGPDERPVAIVDLGAREDLSPDPLFAQVFHRHTNRNPYDTGRTPAPEALEAIVRASGPAGQVASRIVGAADVPAVSEIVREAWRIEVTTPRVLRESVELTRVGGAEIERHRDGISVTGFMPVVARKLGLYDQEAAMDPESSGFRYVLDMGYEQADTARAWLWQSTAGNRRADQLNAGRAYVRAHLKATELGLSLQPMSQVLQEYSEMQDLQRKFLATLGVDAGGRTVQMLARLGYAAPVGPSPRRRLADIVRA